MNVPPPFLSRAAIAVLLGCLPLACGPVGSEPAEIRPSLQLPEAFGRTVADRVEFLLASQRDDGSIALDGKPLKPEDALQAVVPFTFCYLGLDPNRRWKGNPRLREGIRSLGRYLVSGTDGSGPLEEERPSQRAVYAWADAMIRLKAAGLEKEFDFRSWSDPLERACATLMETRLKPLFGVRRFVGRAMGTGANHVAFYLAALYRAGQALDRRDLIQQVLPIARRFAADIHPDGYWEEHGDLLRSGGPTTSYNALTHTCVALLAEWTGEPVFQEAIARSTRFHLNFTYPDGIPFDLIDERVRYKKEPHLRGLFGFSGNAEGRGAARILMENWLALNPPGKAVAPDLLSRLCENQLYWHAGEETIPPFARPDHRAALRLPAALYRQGDWTVGLSAMRATQTEDPAYRDVPFALDRDKLFSVFHSEAGLILDGSHSKGQPENATFGVTALNWNRQPRAVDYLPCGGTVGEENGIWVSRADYRSFQGIVRVRPVTPRRMEITLEADLAATAGPATAGFTFLPKGRSLRSGGGEVRAFGTAPWDLSGKALGAKISYGPILLEGPEGMSVHWPLSPYNSYSKDHLSPPEANLGRVSVLLTPERPRAVFVLIVGDGQQE